MRWISPHVFYISLLTWLEKSAFYINHSGFVPVFIKQIIWCHTHLCSWKVCARAPCSNPKAQRGENHYTWLSFPVMQRKWSLQSWCFHYRDGFSECLEIKTMAVFRTRCSVPLKNAACTMYAFSWFTWEMGNTGDIIRKKTSHLKHFE